MFRVAKYEDDFLQLNEDEIKKEDALEWWYFDIEKDKNNKVIVFYVPYDKAITKKSYIRVEITEDGKNQVILKNFKNCVIKETLDGYLVKFDEDNYLLIGDGVYQGCVKIPNAKISFQAERTLPGVAIGEYIRKGELFAAANFIAPRIIGKAKVNGYEIEGYGYHDHPWGTETFGRIIKEWDWFKGYEGENYFLYANVIPHKGFKGGLNIFYVNGKAIDEYKIKKGNYKRNIYLLKYPGEFNLSWSNNSLEVKLVNDLLNYPVYNRSSIEINYNGNRGEGISEKFAINPLLKELFCRLMIYQLRKKLKESERFITN